MKKYHIYYVQMIYLLKKVVLASAVISQGISCESELGWVKTMTMTGWW